MLEGARNEEFEKGEFCAFAALASVCDRDSMG